MPLHIERVPALRDNYTFLVHCDATGHTAVVDTPELQPIVAALAERGWQLTHIWNTHHHPDHVGANLALKERTGCTIVGPRADAARIPGIDVAVGEGDTVALGEHTATVWDTPAHTRGHISFVLEAERALFPGDTLFAGGCGRLFEGTAEQMWTAMSRYRGLPADTRVYCAHEYTLSNLRFARTVDPHNTALAERFAEVERLRQAGVPTVPTTIALEAATNPFMRADSPAIASVVGLQDAAPHVVLKKVRERKNRG